MLPRSLPAWLMALLVAACGGPKDERPSVIRVSIDTLRADHVGLYGYKRPTTPFLDRWAQQATVFDQAFTTAAWTLVAHMTMLTGLFPEQHGVIGKKVGLSPEIPLLAERLRTAGYRTYGLHNGGWIDEKYGFDRGFSVFREHKGLEEADEHLRLLLPDFEKDGPFFLFLHVFDVHCGNLAKDDSPYPSPERYQHLFTEGLVPLPGPPPERWWHNENVLDEEQRKTLVALYDGGIRHVDDQLGQWFAELDRRGLTKGALIVITSDHGEALGQRGRLDMHGECWQEGLHVPLVVRHPDGVESGSRIERPVHLGDLVPTILETVGLPVDPWLPGTSLFGPLPEARVVYGIKLPQAFVLKGTRKLVMGDRRAVLEMDLANDPRELAPRPGDPQAFDALRAEAMGDHSFPKAIKIELSQDDLKELGELGYGGEQEESLGSGEPRSAPQTPKSP